MKNLTLILLVLCFGCNQQTGIKIVERKWSEIKIKKPIKSEKVHLDHCYKLTIEGSLILNSKGDIINDYRGIVVYIPMDCEHPDTTKGFDLSKLIIVDTVGYAKTLMHHAKMRKYEEEQKLRVNL